MTELINFQLATNMRGEEFLVRDDFNQGVNGILPGGSFDYGYEDQIKNPVFSWRIARWACVSDFMSDLPPTAVQPLSVSEAIKYDPDHAGWIISRAARQLDIVSGFLNQEDISEGTRFLQKGRTEVVLDDLTEAVGIYRKLHTDSVPAQVDESIVAASSLVGRFIH